MTFWVDKYRPKELDKLDYHQSQARNLKNLIADGDFPHMLIYGPSGAGKHTRIMCLLREIYGPSVDRLRYEQMEFVTPSKKKLEIGTMSSNYHVEVTPSDVGIYDRVVVVQLIKTVAQTQQLTGKEFKVVVVNDVDDLTKDAQYALRRTMEKYISNCRLILCANGTSRVTEAIRSRCLVVRVPSPSHSEIISIVQATCKKEGLIVMPDTLAIRIAEKCEGNLRRALLMAESCKVHKYPFVENQPIAEPDYRLAIKEVVQALLGGLKKIEADNTHMSKLLLQIRNTFYELIIHVIPGHVIMEELLSALISNLPLASKLKVTELAAEYEHRMVQGNKKIFHLEAFAAQFLMAML